MKFYLFIIPTDKLGTVTSTGWTSTPEKVAEDMKRLYKLPEYKKVTYCALNANYLKDIISQYNLGAFDDGVKL